MKNILIPSVFATALAIAIAGCQQQAIRNTAANTAEVNAGVNTTVGVNQNTATASDTSSTGSLATPTEAYKTAYALRQKKDIAGLKKVMSKDVLDFLTEIGKADKKSLDDMLREMTEDPQAASPESRNEKITGDRATIEYKDDDGSWRTMDFVKENGEWKLSLPEKGMLETEDKPKKQ